MRLALRSPDGVTSFGGATTRTLRPGERMRVRYTTTVKGEAQLWAPEDPQLYAATVRTVLGGRTIQSDARRIGLRTVEVVDGALRLNGRTLDLRGASIQEDMPGRGPALTDADVETTVAELKSLGANITRAHYLLDERLLRRFDEEGILVWSQAPVYHRDAMLKTPRQRSFELDNLRNTILAARNHPAVITHSVANELTPRARRRQDDAAVDAQCRRARARPRLDAAGRRSTCCPIRGSRARRPTRPSTCSASTRTTAGTRASPSARRRTSTTSRRTCARCTPSTPATRS